MNRKPQQPVIQQQQQIVQNKGAHRVNGSMLPQYKNQRVALVVRSNEEKALIASDGVQVKVAGIEISTDPQTFEIIGIVQPDLSVHAKEVTTFDPYTNPTTGKLEEFDLQTYDELVKLAATSFRELFYD